MSDFMALMTQQQTERELAVNLERRRLQREAAAAAKVRRTADRAASRADGRIAAARKIQGRHAQGWWHRLWARDSRTAEPARGGIHAR
ncbi:hypothetical protein JOF48_003728 [Arthrobacter stackebrandtii]|uniref:Uncharacterized protein n=1 Tax=Arthrobacter stackebrandtii TaxID=272161 RepID=A0ABS4Z1U3_9MICC|nr:hypothetical protein [Arthrobacter stackebrandtii]MBP2414929.1 hypothetical protein [Arthrobacter stackebrandtii]